MICFEETFTLMQTIFLTTSFGVVDVGEELVLSNFILGWNISKN